MRLGNFIHMVSGNLLERKGRTLGAVLIVAFAAAVAMIVAAASQGVLSGLIRKAEEALPPDILFIRPKQVDVSILSFSGLGLTPDVIENIRRLPGVKYVAPQLALKMPLRAEGSVMGQSAETDAVVVGIGPEIVEDDVFEGFSFTDPPDLGANNDHSTSPVPVVVPRFFLDMYNLAYAESVGLPKINESFLRGKQFTLHLGESYLLGSAGNDGGKTRKITLVVVGLTSNPNLMSGILLPLSRAESLNRWFSGKSSIRYNAAHVRIGDPDRADEVTSAVRGMNLGVESQKEKLDQIRFAARAGMAAVAGFAGVILLIAAISILNTFTLIMGERRGEVGLLRAVGATRSLVVRLYLAEVAAIGLAGGLVGTLVAVAGLQTGNRAILSRLPDISYLPETIFRVHPLTVLGVIAVSVAVCVLATLPIVRRHAGISPASLSTE